MMLGSIKAELRKIYTVRSTYGILLFATALLIFFTFYLGGLQAGLNTAAATDPHKLANMVADSVSNLAFFGSLVGILLVTNEYRYNTIMHTLTIARSRSRVLFSKWVAISIFALVFTMFVGLSAAGLMLLGLTFKGLHLSHQVFPTSLIWRTLFMGWGSCMFALIFAVLIRQQVGALATYFIFPGFGELLLGLALRSNRIYLPFTALQQVVTSLNEKDAAHALSSGKAAAVVGVYIVVGGLIAWLSFLRRDSN